MGQLSFFSADYLPPVLADLGGMLAAHGQITISGSGARLSILLTEAARARALVTECTARQVNAEAVEVDGPGRELLARTNRTPDLVPLAKDWTRGAVKTAPAELQVSAGFLRIWAISAGRTDEIGYLLGLDRHAPDSIEALIAACARAGIAGSYIGTRGGGPGIRIVGHRRLARLIDTVGTLPGGLPAECYPTEPRSTADFEPQR